MLATLMGTNPQSLCMPPSNTQLLSFRVLGASRVKPQVTLFMLKSLFIT